MCLGLGAKLFRGGNNRSVRVIHDVSEAEERLLILVSLGERLKLRVYIDKIDILPGSNASEGVVNKREKIAIGTAGGSSGKYLTIIE